MKPRPALLLVEDEPLIRSYLAEALGEAGFLVVEGATGEMAMTQLAAANISVVVTDIRLGAGMSGWDVAHLARQRHPKLAVVYMTGDSAADWASEGVPGSVLVQKPFAAAQIVTAVSSLLNAVA